MLEIIMTAGMSSKSFATFLSFIAAASNVPISFIAFGKRERETALKIFAHLAGLNELHENVASQFRGFF